MRKPGLAFLLLVFTASRSVEASGPINLFRPDTGQRTVFEARYDSGRKVMDTVSFWIASLSGDSAKYGLLYSESQLTGFRAFAWSSGRMTAPQLLRSRTLDTNGIYAHRKTFPADYVGRTATNLKRSGITLQHTVSGFLFDTLLVSCTYSTLDGDHCDFVTPTGVLVYSSEQDGMLYPPGLRYLPDAATLEAMGGKPVPIRLAGNPRRKPLPGLGPMIGPAGEGFDVRGRPGRAGRAQVLLAAPAR